MTLTPRGRAAATIALILTAAVLGYLTAHYGTPCYLETIR